MKKLHSAKAKGSELPSPWYFYHQHKSSEHLLKIPVSWGLNRGNPKNIY